MPTLLSMTRLFHYSTVKPIRMHHIVNPMTAQIFIRSALPAWEITVRKVGSRVALVTLVFVREADLVEDCLAPVIIDNDRVRVGSGIGVSVAVEVVVDDAESKTD